MRDFNPECGRGYREPVLVHHKSSLVHNTLELWRAMVGLE